MSRRIVTLIVALASAAVVLMFGSGPEIASGYQLAGRTVDESFMFWDGLNPIPDSANARVLWYSTALTGADTTGEGTYLTWVSADTTWKIENMLVGDIVDAWLYTDHKSTRVLNNYEVGGASLGDTTVTRWESFGDTVLPTHAFRIGEVPPWAMNSTDSLYSFLTLDVDSADVRRATGDLFVADTVSADTLFSDVILGTLILSDSANVALLLVDGDLEVGGDIVLEGSTADAYETTITVTDPTGDRTVTIPNSSGTVAYTANVVDNSLASGYLVIGSDVGVATDVAMSQDGTINYQGKLALADGSVGPDEIVEAADYEVRDLTISDELFLEGATSDAYELEIFAEDPTQDNVVTIPDTTGTMLVMVAHDTTIVRAAGVQWTKSHAAVKPGDLISWIWTGPPPYYDSFGQRWTCSVGVDILASGVMTWERELATFPTHNPTTIIEYWVFRFVEP